MTKTLHDRVVKELNRENEQRNNERLYHILTWGAIIFGLFLLAGAVVMTIDYLKNGFNMNHAIVMRDYVWIWSPLLLALLICLSVRISIKNTW